MVPINCESELSYILVELFNICLKESYFSDEWEFSSVVPVFRYASERSMTEKSQINY